MKNIVTGGFGFIAGHLIQALLERGDDVIAIDKKNVTPNHIEKLYEKYSKQLIFVWKDLNRKEIGKDWIKGADVVYHLAAETNLKKSVDNPNRALRDDLLSTVNMLEACREYSPLCRFVFTSSAAVYGSVKLDKISEGEVGTSEIISPYGLNKRASELYIELYRTLYGLSTVCVRLFNVYGPGQLNLQVAIPSFILSMLRGEHIKIRGDGFQTRDFVYVSDVVKALLLMGGNNHTGIYNVGTGTAYSLMDLIMYLVSHMKKKFYVDNLPELEWDIRHNCSDISLIEKMVGWEPEVILEEGVIDTIEYYKQMI